MNLWLVHIGSLFLGPPGINRPWLWGPISQGMWEVRFQGAIISTWLSHRDLEASGVDLEQSLRKISPGGRKMDRKPCFHMTSSYYFIWITLKFPLPCHVSLKKSWASLGSTNEIDWNSISWRVIISIPACSICSILFDWKRSGQKITRSLCDDGQGISSNGTINRVPSPRE